MKDLLREVLEKSIMSKPDDANETLNSSIISIFGEEEMMIQTKRMLKFAKKKFPDSPMPLFLKGVQSVLERRP